MYVFFLFQVRCGKCGNGLGHEFVNDGPGKGLSRFWIFSSSLKFIPKGKTMLLCILLFSICNKRILIHSNNLKGTGQRPKCLLGNNFHIAQHVLVSLPSPQIRLMGSKWAVRGRCCRTCRRFSGLGCWRCGQWMKCSGKRPNVGAPGLWWTVASLDSKNRGLVSNLLLCNNHRLINQDNITDYTFTISSVAYWLRLHFLCNRLHMILSAISYREFKCLFKLKVSKHQSLKL